MPDYRFTVEQKGSSTFTDADGNERTIVLDPKGKDQFTTSDPCEYLSFLAGWSGGFHEENPGAVKGIQQDCADQQAALLNQYPEALEVTVTEGPPKDGDDSKQQGAPDVKITAEVETKRSPHDDATQQRRPPTDLVFDQKQPTVPEAILDMLFPDRSPEDGAAFVKRWARNEPEPGEPHATHSGETARHATRGGDPVELFSGTLTLTKVDLTVPTAVLPLQLIRTYRSGRPYYGPWGFGWDHNYNVYLRELTDGGIARWNGALHEDIFRWTGAAFEPARGVHERLERIAGNPHGYTITQRSGTVLRFDVPPGWTHAERIPLLEIRDRHGNTQQFEYDTNNRLSRIRDDDGRALLFHYGKCDLLEAVDDHTGRRVRYDHASDIEHLVRVTLPLSALYAAGVSTYYDYDSRSGHPAMRHNLLRIIDADKNTYAENVYGGPENGWSFNRVARQYYGDFLYEYEYEQIQFVPPGEDFVNVPALRAMMRGPDGSLQTYTFNYRGDLLDYRYRLNKDKSYRVVVSKWEYDAQGNVTVEVAPDGGRTVYTYDSSNENPCAWDNVLKVERFAPPAFVATSRVIFEAAYDSAYQLPRETLDERGARTKLKYDFDLTPGPQATGKLERIEVPDATLPDGTVQQSAIIVETDARGRTTATVTAEGIRDEAKYFDVGPSIGLLQWTLQDVTGVAWKVEYEYDAWGYPKRVTVPPGDVIQLVHDALGQLEEVTLPAVDGKPAKIRWRYNGDGRLVRTERPRGAYEDGAISGDVLVDEIHRNVLGHAVKTVLGANAARPRIWRNLVDHDGRPLKAYDPIEMQTTRMFDERGLLLSESMTPSAGVELTVRYAYDRCGRLTYKEEPGGRITKIEPDPWGHPAHVKLPNGSEQRWIWEAGDLLQETWIEGDPGDGSARRILSHRRFEYDERG